LNKSSSACIWSPGQTLPLIKKDSCCWKYIPSRFDDHVRLFDDHVHLFHVAVHQFHVAYLHGPGPQAAGASIINQVKAVAAEILNVYLFTFFKMTKSLCLYHLRNLLISLPKSITYDLDIIWIILGWFEHRDGTKVAAGVWFKHFLPLLPKERLQALENSVPKPVALMVLTINR
jgi:hypothetical protein